MTRLTRRNLAALALAAGTTLGAWSPVCLGQTPQPQPGGGDRTVMMRVNSTPISIEFPGGTIAEYIRAVQAQRTDNSRPVNVILGPGTERIAVRPIDLRFVSVDTAMDALRFATECEPGELRIERVSTHDDESPTFSILQKSGDASRRQDLEVLSIAPLTRPAIDGVNRPDLAVKSDVVLSAVELALPAGEAPPRMKFHEESQLLIMQGSPRATEAVRQVIKTMIDDQRQRLGDAGRSQKEMIEAAARAEKSRIRLRAAEQVLDLTMSQFERTSELVKQGSVSTEDLATQRAELSNAKAMVLTARTELEEAEALAALIRKQTTDTPTAGSDDLASLRKLVEDQAAQIKSLTEELNALRNQKSAK